MKREILIATDLDRTLIANGFHPESPKARPLFDQIVAKPGVRLAYVSGRDLNLIKDAMTVFALPKPHYVVSDVGTAIWTWQGNDWKRLKAWDDTISPGWNGRDAEEISHLLRGFHSIEKQEPTRQGQYKLSYYWYGQENLHRLSQRVAETLEAHGLRVHTICSLDETTGEKFLDVLPKGASKLGAVTFLMRLGAFSHERVVFSGDSGNDLDVLGSPIQSVLVANATDSVRNDAIALSQKNGCTDALYLAKGACGMNGCYAAGILEGLAHFIPETTAWIE
ncbi:MAG: Alpha,alpha-trehalose-phosphate synthase (UDP-forming) [Magnetococcales bacterium]|nr:Alpha,alpha-trehalose-phosphate synthase (UDP-forming) [Magnetococcales bacterium]HIJ84625.1 HAD-IIB family hydrolase [Magnetococcales bacterium]